MSSLVEFLAQPVWQQLALTLAHFIWQAVVVALVVWGTLALLRIRQPQTEYNLLLVALLALFVCPVVTFLICKPAPFPKPQQLAAVVPAGPVQARVEPEIVAPLRRSQKAIETAAKRATAQPPHSAKRAFNVGGSNNDLASVATFAPAEAGSDGNVGPPVAAAPVPVPPLHSELAQTSLWPEVESWMTAIQPWFVLLWLVGVCLCSVRLTASWLATCWLRSTGLPVAAEIDQLVDRLRMQLGLRQAVRVGATSYVSAALVLGLWRPVILLPAAWLLTVPPDLLEAVLAHELAHIRRYDLWVNLLQRVAEALFFFHPAVWWLSGKLRDAREACCDASAVRVTGDRLAYVRALEQVAVWQVHGDMPLTAAAFGEKKQMKLLRRVRMVLGLQHAGERVRWWPAAVLALCVPAGLAWQATGIEADEPKPAEANKPAAAAPAVAKPAAEETPEAALLRILETKVDLDLVDVTISEVLDYLRIHHKLPALLDRAQLAQAGDLEQRLTLQVKQLPLRRALNSMLQFHGLATLRVDGVLIVTSVAAAEAHTERMVVDVADLLQPDPTCPEPSTALVKAIKHTIMPESWFDLGGRGSVKTLGNTLVVSNSQATLDQVRTFLAALRRVKAGHPLVADLARQKLESSLKQRVSVDFQDMLLVEAVDYLRQMYKVPLYLTGEATESEATKITLRADGIPLRMVLGQVAAQAQLTYLVDEDQIRLATLGESEAELVTRFYAVNDLLTETDPNDLAQLLEESIDSPVWSNGRGFTGQSVESGFQPSPQIAFFGDVLIVAQTPQTQTAVRELLNELRVARGLTVK